MMTISNANHGHLSTGWKITYDLAYFFRWYVSSGMLIDTVVKCTVVDGSKTDVIVVNVMLPTDIVFNEKAFALCRCAQQGDNSWNLMVINDPTLIVDVVIPENQAESRHNVDGLPHIAFPKASLNGFVLP
jgi:hypothetical protein